MSTLAQVFDQAVQSWPHVAAVVGDLHRRGSALRSLPHPMGIAQSGEHFFRLCAAFAQVNRRRDTETGHDRAVLTPDQIMVAVWMLGEGASVEATATTLRVDPDAVRDVACSAASAA